MQKPWSERRRTRGFRVLLSSFAASVRRAHGDAIVSMGRGARGRGPSARIGPRLGNMVRPVSHGAVAPAPVPRRVADGAMTRFVRVDCARQDCTGQRRSWGMLRVDRVHGAGRRRLRCAPVSGRGLLQKFGKPSPAQKTRPPHRAAASMEASDRDCHSI